MEKQTLGDYSLLKKIGSSGFGEVFLAEHRFIKKQYALKVLNEQLSSNEKFMEAFEKDVGVLASLDHPSIVKIHNISCAEGKYFIVMDAMVDEKGNIASLQNFLEKRGTVLSEMQVETILRQLASALDYAHRFSFENKQLIHRGIKPSNIFLYENEKGLRVYLSDFAMSRIIGEGKVLQATYEKAVQRLSCKEEEITPYFLENFSFLAPEQKDLQKKEKITAKTDSYSFGVLAYYLIVKDFPEGYFDMPTKIAQEYKLNWDLFICRCLKKDPNKRPEQLIETLNSCLSSQIEDLSSLDILSWEEVERKVENAMQMSFEFSVEEEEKEKKKTEKNLFHPKNMPPKPVILPQQIDRPTYDPDPGAIFQKELNVSYYQPKKVEIKEVEPLLTEMVIIPGGTYSRGSNNGARDEMPSHKVVVSSFALDIHSIANEQFLRFLESMGGEKDANNNDIIRLRDSRIKRSVGKLIIESGYNKHPVVGVTWYGAMAYAKWVGKRLPTEAEWEIASMGGVENAVYPTGSDIDHTQANFFNSDTTSVMSYPPNGYGLFDVVGNVYEWCGDWYAYNYYDTSLQEPENPTGPRQGVYRVLRGGCWKSLKEDLRCSHRHRNNPGAFNSTYGFRCATDVS